MNDILLKLIMALLTDDNLHKLIDPVKADLCAKLQAQAALSPEIYDDVLVKVLKVILGVA